MVNTPELDKRLRRREAAGFGQPVAADLATGLWAAVVTGVPSGPKADQMNVAVQSAERIGDGFYSGLFRFLKLNIDDQRV